MGARPAVYGSRLACVRLAYDFTRRRRALRLAADGCSAATARGWAEPTGAEGGPWVLRRRGGGSARVVRPCCPWEAGFEKVDLNKSGLEKKWTLIPMWWITARVAVPFRPQRRVLAV